MKWVCTIILAILIGVILGWFANDLLGARYFLITTDNPEIVFRIDTRTGETWTTFPRERPTEFSELMSNERNTTNLHWKRVNKLRLW